MAASECWWTSDGSKRGLVEWQWTMQPLDVKDSGSWSDATFAEYVLALLERQFACRADHQYEADQLLLQQFRFQLILSLLYGIGRSARPPADSALTRLTRVPTDKPCVEVGLGELKNLNRRHAAHGDRSRCVCPGKMSQVRGKQEEQIGWPLASRSMVLVQRPLRGLELVRLMSPRC